MTLEELFAASSNGFPEVESLLPISGATSKIGRVVELKVSQGDGYKGCGVSFPGLNYVTWFYAKDMDDKRKKYMKDLKIINQEQLTANYINGLLNCFPKAEFERLVYGSWYMDEQEKFNRRFNTKPVPMPVCTKPNCRCLEAEESKQGGPVKNYPCLCDSANGAEQENASLVSHWVNKLNALTEENKKRSER